VPVVLSFVGLSRLAETLLNGFCRKFRVAAASVGYRTMTEFKGSQLEREVILWVLRGYVAWIDGTVATAPAQLNSCDADGVRAPQP
jgi:hypothetical protein